MHSLCRSYSLGEFPTGAKIFYDPENLTLTREIALTGQGSSESVSDVLARQGSSESVEDALDRQGPSERASYWASERESEREKERYIYIYLERESFRIDDCLED